MRQTRHRSLQLLVVLSACILACISAPCAEIVISDNSVTTIDSNRELLSLLVSDVDVESPHDVVVGIEASVSFSRKPDRHDNFVNPFYEDIRFALISPSETFVPLIDFDTFDTVVPNGGFTGTLDFSETAETIIGDLNQDGHPDGSIMEGTFRPLRSFEELYGELALGEWQLLIEDRLNGTVLDYMASELRISTEPPTECDAQSNTCDVGIDELTLAIKDGVFVPEYDLDQNGTVDGDDRRFWIVELNRTYYGDSNLDGQFDSSDFVAVFQAAEYEDEIFGNSTWSTGDWSGDCEFDSRDFVVAFQEAGYEAGPRSAQQVPEPVNSVFAWGAWCVFILRHRF